MAMNALSLLQDVSFFIALIATFLLIPWHIEKAKERGLTGKDMNKLDQPTVAELGGITVVIGFIAGVCFHWVADFSNTDYLPLELNYPMLSAGLLAILGAAFTGIMDDLFNMRQRVKAVLPFLFAIPFALYASRFDPSLRLGPMSIIADTFHIGTFEILLPFALALLFALGVTCAANAANMLEGFNGLGAGMGLIITVALIIMSIYSNKFDGTILLFPLLGALTAFLYFNSYKASIFPGDTLMLFMGATLAVAAIMSHLKTAGGLLFMPMIVEFVLKLRGKFKAENYCCADEKGFLCYKGKVESLTHLVMKIRPMKEWQLVGVFWLIQGVWSALVIALLMGGFLR